MMKKYSILTVNTGGYELLPDPEVVNPDVEYVCVTDNPDMHSDIWHVIYRPGIWFLYVKHHPFEFITTDVCLWLDGSYKIIGDPTDNFVMPFINSDKEFAISVHDERHNIFEELCNWICKRNFSKANAEALYSDMVKNRFSSDTLFQTSCMLFKKTDFTNFIFACVVDLENRCSVDGLFRDDQTLFSYAIAHNLYDDKRILLMNFEYTADNPYFIWMEHGTDCPLRPKQLSFRCFDKEQPLLYCIH